MEGHVGFTAAYRLFQFGSVVGAGYEADARIGAQVADAQDLLVAHQVGDALDEGGFVGLVGKLGDDDAGAAPADLLEVGFCLHDEARLPHGIALGDGVRVLAVLGVGGTVLGYLSSVLINPNAGYIVFMTMVGLYLNYETFHYCCHVHDNWFVRNIPFINTIRRHHTAHHNMGIMMKYNMNLTYPIADWLMGTSDLRRGLLGHLFNGTSEEHVKAELRPIIARFRNSDIQNARVTLDGPVLDKEEKRAMAM